MIEYQEFRPVSTLPRHADALTYLNYELKMISKEKNLEKQIQISARTLKIAYGRVKRANG